MRGLPGSGKSTYARELASIGSPPPGEDRLPGYVFSTDDYFVRNGVYCFNGRELGYAHLWNQNRAFMAMMAGNPVIIIDNTHVQAWEAQNYVKAGLLCNYDIEIVEPKTSWAFDPMELMRKNTHNVPLEVIKGMLARWEKNITVNDILNSCAPPRN